MKILLITSFFPPVHTAGTERRTFGYARALLGHGHSVQVLCAGTWHEGDHYWNGVTDEIYQGIPVCRVNLNWQKSPDPNGYLYRNPRTAEFLHKCLVDWQPDIVHITSCLTLSASIIATAKDFGLPVVLTLTDFWFVCHSLNLLRHDGSMCDGHSNTQDCLQCMSWNSGAHQKIKKLTSVRVATQIFDTMSRMPFFSRQRGLRGYALNIAQRRNYLMSILNLADIITAPSNHLRDMLWQSGVKNEIRVIYSGHDLSWLKAYNRQGFNKVVRFGYVGQFIPTKGVQVLLTAFSGCDWQGKAELNLFGDVDAKSVFGRELQEICKRNARDIHFHGAFPHEKLGEVLSGLDVLIVPSIWLENNPRVVQESFACKIPVIASDVGGISEFVEHEVNGLMFERGNVNDLQTQLQRIVHEPGLLERLKSGIPPVKLIEDEVSEFEAIYKTLTATVDRS